VGAHGPEQDDAGHPEQEPAREKRGAQRAQACRVGIEVLRPLEDLQVTEQVRDDEQQQDHAGDGHDQLLADQRADEARGGRRMSGDEWSHER